MNSGEEKRKHQRIRYSWPLWFGFSDSGEFHRAQVVDLSQSGVSYTVSAQRSPSVGEHVKTRFSYPLNHGDQFAMGNYYHWSEVVRVDTVMPGVARVAMRLHEPLPTDPAMPMPCVSVDEPELLSVV